MYFGGKSVENKKSRAQSKRTHHLVQVSKIKKDNALEENCRNVLSKPSSRGSNRLSTRNEPVNVVDKMEENMVMSSGDGSTGSFRTNQSIDKTMGCHLDLVQTYRDHSPEDNFIQTLPHKETVHSSYSDPQLNCPITLSNGNSVFLSRKYAKRKIGTKSWIRKLSKMPSDKNMSGEPGNDKVQISDEDEESCTCREDFPDKCNYVCNFSSYSDAMGSESKNSLLKSCKALEEKPNEENFRKIESGISISLLGSDNLESSGKNTPTLDLPITRKCVSHNQQITVVPQKRSVFVIHENSNKELPLKNENSETENFQFQNYVSEVPEPYSPVSKTLSKIDIQNEYPLENKTTPENRSKVFLQYDDVRYSSGFETPEVRHFSICNIFGKNKILMALFALAGLGANYLYNNYYQYPTQKSFSENIIASCKSYFK